MLTQPVGDDKVVDAPAHVPGAGRGPVAPPGVGVGPIGIEPAEAVGKASLQKLGELGPLLIGEAGVAHIGLGVFQVDLLVGHVHIAADDHGLLGVQPLQVGAEIVLPLHAVVDALELVLGVGRIDRHQPEIRVFQRDDPALGVVLWDAQVVAHAQGLVLGENRRAGIALFLGIVPIHMIARQIKIPELSLRQLYLLQTYRIGSAALCKIKKSLINTGSESVDIP